MAFQPPSSRQEIQNRKILEELQLKKQLLLKQGAAAALNTTPITPTPIPVGSTMPFTTGEAHTVSSTQRSALQFAHTQSFGYFVSQDSLFGNLILPVLPRFDIPPFKLYSAPLVPSEAESVEAVKVASD